MELDMIKLFAVNHGYEDIVYLNTWRGYDSYEPIFIHDEVSYVGPPLIIIVKGDSIRFSTVAEGFEHIRWDG